MTRWFLVVALALSTSAPGVQEAVPPVEAAPPEEEMVPVVFHKVVDVREGKLVLGAGSAAGFTPGKSVRIFRRLEKPDPRNPAATHELMAIVRIERADADRAWASLGRGETAQVGDSIDLTTEYPTASTFAPPRPDYTYRASVSLRPFLGGSNGFGMLLAGALSYRVPNSVFTLNVALEPLSVGLGAGFGTHLVGTAAWSMTYFELAAGLAAMPGPFCGFGSCSPVMIGFVFGGRLGSLDGLSLNLNIGTSLIGHYSVGLPMLLLAELNAAITREIGLFAKASASASFDNSVMGGVRLLTQGGGERGSILYSVAIGYMGISGAEYVGGVTLSLGAEFRF